MCAVIYLRPVALSFVNIIVDQIWLKATIFGLLMHAVGHFCELLPWHGKNCIQPIEAKNAHLILFCSDSGRCTDQSWMTDQVSSGDGQHSVGRQAASIKPIVREVAGSRGATGRQKGGDVD
jgi:hypothetical protein